MWNAIRDWARKMTIHKNYWRWWLLEYTLLLLLLGILCLIIFL